MGSPTGQWSAAPMLPRVRSDASGGGKHRSVHYSGLQLVSLNLAAEEGAERGLINARERLPRSTRAPAVKARSCPTPEQRRTALREGGAIKRRRNSNT